ncbi:conserved exported protein of unknown function [Nitrospira sp. KM1]|uniref:ComEA family DNA-binding protein n=1 Tax=Nitrospira sp. KM1 TaxID=1936990 RepID=UPI0013A7A84C|nr:ComEA family DNA-binding protein [Nitrospira sp. KM1]BCA53659.1 conserved exported protein of unknown function [Nitrospira sp. KM1]
MVARRIQPIVSPQIKFETGGLVLLSLLIRLGMVVFTMAMIFWVGWGLPQADQEDRGADVQAPRQTQMPELRQAVAVPSAVQHAEGLDRPRTSVAVRRLDLNRATAQDLEGLPGIGPVLAGRIIQHREELGSFRSVEDLRTVKGIGKKTLERIRTLVDVPGHSVLAKDGKKT